MRVIILAAGRGEQLGELTETVPKCMLPFGQETLLGRQIRLLGKMGIAPSDISVVAGYRAEALEGFRDINLIKNEKYGSTDNSHSLWLALQECSEDVVVLDGDLVYEEEAVSPFLRVRGNAVLVTEDNGHIGNTGIMAGRDNVLTEIGKHLSGKMRYACAVKLTPESAVSMRKFLGESISSWYTVALNRILKSNVFHVCHTPYNIVDINTYGDYLEAKRQFGIGEHVIWVTGASGFLGQKVYHILKRNYSVVGTKGKSGMPDLQSIDLLNRDAVQAYAKLTNPGIIVHTAGIPEPEKCDGDRSLAYRANVEAVKNLVCVCRDMGIKLIHISTDYVFDGESGEAYGRDAQRKPKNYYGMTKLLAEDEVRQYGNSLIIRVPLLYGFNNKQDKVTFPVKVIRKLKEGEEIFLDNKQIRYPVLTDDVAFGIADALNKRGIIHLTSGEPVTKYSWALMIAREFGLDAGLVREDKNSSLENRPPHVRLSVESGDYLVTGAEKGTAVLRKQMACAFQLIYKSSPVETVYDVNVGCYRHSLGRRLAAVLPREILQETDYVVPVPASGLFYAMGLAEAAGVPYLQALVKPDERARSFQISDISLREQIIRNKIMPVRELLENRNIILVDEAIFTGITLRVVCDMVKACGAGKIYIAIPTPICRSTCRQYVQPERRLLSQDVSEEDLANYFRVSGVFFQKYEVFESLNSKMEGICQECFQG